MTSTLLVMCLILFILDRMASNNAKTPIVSPRGNVSSSVLNTTKLEQRLANQYKTPIRLYNKLEGFITTDPENSSIKIYKKRLTKSMVRPDYQNKIENGRSYIVGIDTSEPKDTLIHLFYTKDYKRVNDPTLAYTEIKNKINRDNYGPISNSVIGVNPVLVSPPKKGGKRKTRKTRKSHTARKSRKSHK